MAGIGFELRKMLSKDSYAGVLGAYGYAGLVSSGPWVFSIIGVLAIGLIAGGAVSAPDRVTQFLISVTYLMAGSAMFTGPLQLMFSRFVADRVYEDRRDRILPNLLGALTVTTLSSGALASFVVFRVFPGPFTCQALLVANFVVLCDAWLLTVLLSGIKAHRWVVSLYLAAYVASVAASFALRRHDLAGLLAGFLIGQSGAMFAALSLSIRTFPGERRARFEFLDPTLSRYDLALVGAVFYTGAWSDKALFWMNPGTSAPVLGPLRSSIIYDLPIFLAYLSVIPATAALFLWLEADFGDRCQGFFAAIRDGASLDRIERLKDGMMSCVRRGLFDIVKIQAVTLALIFVSGPAVLRMAGISPLYLRLLYVDAVGVAFQVQFLAVLNVLFYLDERRSALALTSLFAAANVALTILSQRLGPDWYGFGFATAALLTAAAAVPLLSHKLARLECSTFMMQPLWPDENRGRLSREIAAAVSRAIQHPLDLFTSKDSGGVT